MRAAMASIAPARRLRVLAVAKDGGRLPAADEAVFLDLDDDVRARRRSSARDAEHVPQAKVEGAVAYGEREHRPRDYSGRHGV